MYRSAPRSPLLTDRPATDHPSRDIRQTAQVGIDCSCAKRTDRPIWSESVRRSKRVQMMTSTTAVPHAAPVCPVLRNAAKRNYSPLAEADPAVVNAAGIFPHWVREWCGRLALSRKASPTNRQPEPSAGGAPDGFGSQDGQPLYCLSGGVFAQLCRRPLHLILNAHAGAESDPLR
jgi:hypothetical protein